MDEFNILIVTDPRSAGIRDKLQSSLLQLYTPDMTLHVNAVTSPSGILSDQTSFAKQNKLDDEGKYDFLYLLGGNEHMVCVENNIAGSFLKFDSQIGF